MGSNNKSTLIDLANKIIKEQTKDSYLNALFFSQLFEMQLKFLLNACVQLIDKNIKNATIDYKPRIDNDKGIGYLISRLKTFYPREVAENKKFIDTLKQAQESRNKFIHSAFKINSKHGEFLNISDDKITHKDSLKKLRKWISDYAKASEGVQAQLDKFQDVKIHIKDL